MAAIQQKGGRMDSRKALKCIHIQPPDMKSIHNLKVPFSRKELTPLAHSPSPQVIQIIELGFLGTIVHLTVFL